MKGQFFSYRNLFFLALLVVTEAIFFWAVLVNGTELYRENGCMENLQAVLLIAGIVAFAVSAYRLAGRQRLLAAFLALLCFIFLFRELDIDRMEGIPQFLVFLMADNRGRAIFVLAELAMLVAILRDFRHYLAHRGIYLRSDLFIYLATSAFLLLVFSQAYDRKWLHTKPQVFYEELTELSAYYFLLVAALVCLPELRRIAARVTATPLP